jgi:hypothetical protein
VPRIRISFSKLGRAVFTPHVDLPILFTRAARRAGIPMEYTQGFSPHPKTVLGPPLPVGVSGLGEPAEFWFVRWDEVFFKSWKESMPDGFRILSAKEADGAPLTKLCTAASYIIEPLNGASAEDIRRVLDGEFSGLGTLLSIGADERRASISVTDLERSGASRMVKALVSSGTVSGWRDLSFVRTAVGRWDACARRTAPLTEE